MKPTKRDVEIVLMSAMQYDISAARYRKEFGYERSATAEAHTKLAVELRDLAKRMETDQ
jgi:hypothetical protein